MAQLKFTSNTQSFCKIYDTVHLLMCAISLCLALVALLSGDLDYLPIIFLISGFVDFLDMYYELHENKGNRKRKAVSVLYFLLGLVMWGAAYVSSMCFWF